MPQNRRSFLATMSLGLAAGAVSASGAAEVAPAQKAANAATLRFKEGRAFRILQLTDTHYIPGDKRCAQVDAMIEKALAEDRPDLVVHTGDCVTNSRMKEGWDRFAGFFAKHRVPFAAVMGNHDHEGKNSRKSIVEYVSRLPGSLTQNGPADLPGHGNYTLPILAPDGQRVRFVLYLMDSRAYARDTVLKDVKGIGKYCWFSPLQVQWFRERAADYRQANGAPVPAAAFFHIPLPEYYDAWQRGDMKPVGEMRERSKTTPICSPNVNSGMFYAMLESRSMLCTFCGHDHDNDFVGRHLGVGLAYGRFTGGTNTYQHWENGVRLIDIAPDGRSLTTFTHLRSGAYGPKVTLAL